MTPGLQTGGSIVVFSAGGGHAQRMLPLVAALVKRGRVVHVMTRPEVGRQVDAAGATFWDLFGRYPLDAVDRESIPLPSRLVTFAAAYLEPLLTEVSRLHPALLVYDSFVVVAPLIGRRLGVPYVGMRAGHAQVPARAIAETRRDPRVAISAACEAAAAKLRDEHGMIDASPFSYLGGLSPHLNLYPEPAAFLSEDERQAFEPIAFFGSLDPDMSNGGSHQRPLAGGSGRTRVYVSFGTVIWRYYADIALAAMLRLADVFSQYDADVLVSLGRYAADSATRRRLVRPKVRVENYVDQWGALQDTDLFVTHHGLNSTHEAVFHQVPMLSYPFFGDQPAMSECCRRLGLAVPLSNAPREALDTMAAQRSIEAVLLNHEAFTFRLAEAKTWELQTIEGREAVVDRMLTLA